MENNQNTERLTPVEHRRLLERRNLNEPRFQKEQDVRDAIAPYGYDIVPNPGIRPGQTDNNKGDGWTLISPDLQTERIIRLDDVQPRVMAIVARTQAIVRD